MIRVFSRRAWRAAYGRGTPDGRKRELFVHHSAGTFGGPAPSIDTAKEQAAVMRAIEAFHVRSNGWAAIGYSYVVFQPYGRLRMARIFEGRGPDTIPAAQANHNAGTIAVCVVDGAKGEKLKLSTKLQLIRLARKLKREKGITRLGGHRDVTATSCPGPFITPALDEIANRAGLKRI